MGVVPVLIVSYAKRQTKNTLIFATNCLDFISVHLFLDIGYILLQQNDIIYLLTFVQVT